MVRRNRRHRFVIGAAVSILALVPISSSAEVQVEAANTQTAACGVRLLAAPVSYTPVISTSPPGGYTAGVLSVTVNSSCVGSGYAYTDTQIEVWLYRGVTPQLISSISHDCGAVTSCTYGFSFAGGPYLFNVQGVASWTSTNGQPWVTTPQPGGGFPFDFWCGLAQTSLAQMNCFVSQDFVA